MDQASPLFDRPDRRHAGTIALPTVVIRFAVAPRTTMTWRAPRDAELRTHGHGAYKFSRKPTGDVLRIARGERIWLGTVADDRPAEATLTTAYVRRGERFRRTLAQVQRLLFGIAGRSG